MTSAASFEPLGRLELALRGDDLARRSRSASAWRAMARCIAGGDLDVLDLDDRDLDAPRRGRSSMICCRIVLILSRSDSSSSS